MPQWLSTYMICGLVFTGLIGVGSDSVNDLSNKGILVFILVGLLLWPAFIIYFVYLTLFRRK